MHGPQAIQTDKRTAGVFLDTLSDIAYKEIEKNREFVLPGFGKLVKQKREARTGFTTSVYSRFSQVAKQPSHIDTNMSVYLTNLEGEAQSETRGEKVVFRSVHNVVANVRKQS